MVRKRDKNFQYILPVGQYRSQGEASFADWLDAWRIPYVYEPECLKLPSGEFYRPDFVLPISEVMIEVKPMIFKEELYKAKEAAEILPEGWHFWIVEMYGQKPVPVDVYQANGEISEREQYVTWGMDEGYKDLARDGWVSCYGCLRPFIASAATWNCPHCGAYEGDHLLILDFDVMNPPEALEPLELCAPENALAKYRAERDELPTPTNSIGSPLLRF